MSISPELNSKIENDMNTLDKKVILRSGRSYNDFVYEYSGLTLYHLPSPSFFTELSSSKNSHLSNGNFV